MSLRSLACPSCGAPVRWPRGAEEASCLHCTQILVRDAGGDRLRRLDGPDGAETVASRRSAELAAALRPFDDTWRERLARYLQTDSLSGTVGVRGREALAFALILVPILAAGVLLLVPGVPRGPALIVAAAAEGVVLLIVAIAWAHRRVFERAYARYQEERLELIRRIRAAAVV